MSARSRFLCLGDRHRRFDVLGGDDSVHGRSQRRQSNSDAGIVLHGDAGTNDRFFITGVRKAM